MKIAAKTFGIYLLVIIVIGIGLGITHIPASISSPLEGIAYAAGFSIRIFYITIPLLVAVYFGLRRFKAISQVSTRSQKSEGNEQ